MPTMPRFQPGKHRRASGRRFFREARPKTPAFVPAPSQEQLIQDWVERAHRHTTVEAIGDPEGFVALCPPARGAIAFGYSAQEAIDEMRDVLSGWAYFSLEDGAPLPAVANEASAG